MWLHPTRDLLRRLDLLKQGVICMYLDTIPTEDMIYVDSMSKYMIIQLYKCVFADFLHSSRHHSYLVVARDACKYS